MLRRLPEYILWLLLVLPACLLYTENTADWGDDWAAYYTEAHNIAHGLSAGQTHYRFFDYNDHYAPPGYPAGYPLLLAPVVARTGMDMRTLGLYMSIWAAVWMALAATFLRRRYGAVAAICAMVIYLLCPYILETKGRLWSDIPFAFFMLAGLWLYEHRDKPVYAIAAGLCTGMAIACRSIGLVLIAAMTLDAVALLATAPGQARLRLLSPLARIATGICIPIVVIRLVYPVSGGGYYLRQFGSATAAGVWSNLHTYLDSCGSYLTGQSGSTSATITAIIVLLCITAGLLTHRGARVPGIVLILMIMVVIIFPDTQDMRYLIPVLPLAACYMIAGIHWLCGRSRAVSSLLLVLLTIWVVGHHTSQYAALWSRRHLGHTYGPFTEASQRGLAAVKDIVPDHSLILCRWPRVTGLMTDRDCCVIPEGDLARQLSRLSVARPDYVLSIDERDAEMTDRIATAHRDSVVYDTDGIRLYRCKPWP